LDKGNHLLLLLISILIINFLISDNLNYDDGKTATAVFAQETTAGQFSTYTNEEYDITMQYPSDWTKNEGAKEEYEYEIEGYKDDYEYEEYQDIRIVSFSNNIESVEGDVSLYIDPDYDLSLEEYLSGIIEFYEKNKDGFEMISSSANTDQTLSGSPAYVLEYIVRGNDDDFLDNRFLELGTKIDNDYYIVEFYAAEGDDYLKSLPIAQKMIDSIKIGNDAATSTLSPQLQPQPSPQLQSVPTQSQQPIPQQQNLNNLNQQQLVDQIATTISNANNNIDKNKIVQTINDMIEPINAKGGNVIESLQRIANAVSKDPSGVAANNIINAANKK
jgi:hypothetical protein